MDVAVGTCGYQYYDPVEGWKDEYESKLQAYTDAFPTGELNRTFYELPMIETAERWRAEAVSGFTFTLKAWQAMTHPASSPTWNSHRDALPEGDVGYLRPTAAVRDAWRETRARAEALDASVVVLQTPPSFDCTDAHARNMRDLLGSIERGDLTLAWEPRGDWKATLDRVADLCADLDLVHVTDLLRRYPVTDGPAYVRLHGLNEDPYDYAYDYDDAELARLADRLDALADGDRAFCMFNNDAMYENAQRLRETIP
ncbi:MAG: DUF72 domain-containing protein [Halobacteriaceae archaeon]